MLMRPMLALCLCCLCFDATPQHFPIEFPRPAVSNCTVAQNVPSCSMPALTREQLIFELGDLDSHDSEAIKAVIDALDDNEELVRLNAFAAVRKLGGVATESLLQKVRDDSRSQHVATYSRFCDTAYFSPTRGDVAAASLALVDSADIDLIWQHYLKASGTAKRRLDVAIRVGSFKPTTQVIAASFSSEDPRQRELVFDLIDTIQPDTVDLAAELFRISVATQDPVTLGKLSRWLAADSRPKSHDPQAVKAWLAAIEQSSVLQFIRQPLPSDKSDWYWHAAAAKLFVREPYARPAIRDLVLRLNETKKTLQKVSTNRLFYALASTSGSTPENDELWHIALRLTDIHGVRFLRGLGVPSVVEQPQLARQIVQLAFSEPSEIFSNSRDGELIFRLDSVWKAQLLTATLSMANRQVVDKRTLAKLLVALEAPKNQVVQALRSTANSSPTLKDRIWALEKLYDISGETAWALNKFKTLLAEQSDSGQALDVANGIQWVAERHKGMPPPEPLPAHLATPPLAPASFRPDSQWIETLWAVAADGTAPLAARRAAATVVYHNSQTRRSHASSKWLRRSIQILNSSDKALRNLALDFLSDLSPDPEMGESASRASESHNSPYGFGLERTVERDPGLLRELEHQLSRIEKSDTTAARTLVRIRLGLKLPLSANLQAFRKKERKEDELDIFGYMRETLRTRTAENNCASVMSLDNSGLDRARLLEDLLLRMSFTGKQHHATVGHGDHDQLYSSDCLDKTLPEIIGVLDPAVIQGSLLRALKRTDADWNERAELDLQKEVVLEERLAPRYSDQKELFAIYLADTIKPKYPLSQPEQPNRIDLLSQGFLIEPPRGFKRIVESLPLGFETVLLQHLERDGQPNRLWMMLFEAYLVRSTPIAASAQAETRSNFPDRSLLSEDQRIVADRLLLMLANKWSSIPKTQRLALMRFFSVAATEDTSLKAILKFSLARPIGDERLAAVELGRSRQLNWPEITDANVRESIAESVRTNLMPTIDSVFHQLYRPAETCRIGSPTSALVPSLPQIPWPPLPGYQPPEALDQEWFGGEAATGGTMYKRMKSAFSDISANFEVGLFAGPPNGFALVARMERIRENGDPFPDRARWTRAGRAKVDFKDLLNDLFLEKPGYFRIVVFVVTDEVVFAPSLDRDGRSLPDVSFGSQVMPDELTNMPLKGKHIFALVYSFQRPAGQQMQIWNDGNPSTRQHLQAAGLWDRLLTVRQAK